MILHFYPYVVANEHWRRPFFIYVTVVGYKNLWCHLSSLGQKSCEQIVNSNSCIVQVEEPKEEITALLLVQPSANLHPQLNQNSYSDVNYRIPCLPGERLRPEPKHYVWKKTFVFVPSKKKRTSHPNKFRATRGTVKLSSYSVKVQLRSSNTANDVYARTLCPIRFPHLTAEIVTAYLNLGLFWFLLRERTEKFHRN